MRGKKEKALDEYTEVFKDLISDNMDLVESIDKHLISSEDIADLGEIQIYDYESKLEEDKREGEKFINELADLYLGDNDNIRNNSYIIKKVKEDAEIFAQTKFLQGMTLRNYITQLKQIDSGDNNARMHEVLNSTVGEIRENIKFSQTQKVELEKFYKQMRSDLGLRDMSEKIEKPVVEEPEDKKKTRVVNNSELNDLVQKVMREKNNR